MSFLDNVFGNRLQGVEVTGSTSLTDAIRAELNRSGVMPTDRFIVNIAPPPMFNVVEEEGVSTMSGIEDTISMIANRTSIVNMPGIQVNTSSIRRYTVGLEERKPMSAAVVDQQISIIGDSSNVIHHFFYSWINSIITANKFEPSDTSQLVNSYRTPGSVLYKKDYQTTIEIHIYSNTQKVTIVRLHNAYPVALGDVQMSWENSNSFMVIPVTFTYTHWTTETKQLEDGANYSNSSIISKLYSGASAALLLSTLRRPRNIQDVLGVVNTAKTVISGLSGFRFP